MVTLQEAKDYLKVDTDDDDSLITILLDASERIVMDLLRVDTLENETNNQVKDAIFYALHYLYDERGNANHNELMLTLRALLSNLREVKF